MQREILLKLLTTIKAEVPEESVDLIETHISWVITTAGYAYKIKKSIKYSFLNYTSLKLRKFYCKKELILNSRLTHGIYLGIMSIKKHRERVFMGSGIGTVIDYAVKMKKLEAGKQMNVMLQKNKVTNEHMISIARKLSIFHQDAKIIRTPFSSDQVKSNFNDILIVKDYLIEHIGESAGVIIDRSIDSANLFVDENQELFKNRIKCGLIRDLHGDLHSKNIFLYDSPVIFDCVEFNDDYRRIDVLNEIAFFCMDLDAFDRRDLSTMFLNTYLEMFPAISNQEEENLFIYYKCYRSNVRAKVNALRAQQAVNSDERERWLAESERYLRLMNGYVFNGLSEYPK